MAAIFDVAGRLADGLAAVDTLQTYVSACRVRGYSHPDLTAHEGQVRWWYGMQDGLDLTALDADCNALRTALTQAQTAAEMARGQARALAEAWKGGGGTSALEFVGSHCDTVNLVVEGLGAAGAACERLRDELWQLVDRQVSATLSADDAAQTQRAQWLSAAHAVLTGGTEHDAEVIDSQVKPFVENVVRGQWVPAMRSIADDIGTAYRSATDTVDRYAGVQFEIPGDLGPRPAFSAGRADADGSPPAPPAPAASSSPAPVMPATMPGPPPVMPWSAPTSPIAPAVDPAAGVSPPNPLDTLASALQSPVSGGLPGLGSGVLPDLGTVTGLPGRFADALGGLISGTGGGPDIPDIAAPDLDGPEPAALERDELAGAAEERGQGIGEEPGEDGPGSDQGADGDEAGCGDCGATGADAADAETAECTGAQCGPGEAECDEDTAQDAEQPTTPEAGPDGGTEPDVEAPQDPEAEAAAPQADASTPETASPPADSGPAVPPAAPPDEAKSETGEPKTPCEIAADELPQAGE